MIEYKTGNVLYAEADALVNSVNCVGVMGRGVALQFKRAFPNNFKAYAAACQRGEVLPGKMFVFPTEALTRPHWIINFPTKRHWRGKSRMDDIESGLAALVKVIEQHKITSVALPPLGSGLGGLMWEQVRVHIEESMQSVVGCKVIVFEPSEVVPNNPSTEVPEMTTGRAALMALMHRYLQGLLDPFVTLLEVHKLLYFLQAAGERLRLKYTKHTYGPYATNLRHLLNKVEGHFISGYSDGDNPDKRLDLVPGTLDDARMYLADIKETQERLDKVGDLVAGFESPFGMELLASVHWVMTEDGVHSEQGIIDKVHAWNTHKKQFSPRQINIAQKVLHDKGWVGD